MSDLLKLESFVEKENDTTQQKYNRKLNNLVIFIA
jgi:hypothetical protein